MLFFPFFRFIFSMHTNSNQNIITLNHLAHSQNISDQTKRNDDEHNPRSTNSTTTYASVLSQGASNQQSNQNHSLSKQQQQQQQKNEEKDPFAAIRELGQRSNGLYNYFQ